MKVMNSITERYGNTEPPNPSK